MLKYATLAYSIKGHIISARLQAGTGMIGAASVVEATPGAMRQAVYAFTHPQNDPLADEPAAHGARQAHAEDAQVQARRGAGDRVAVGPERHVEDR